MENILPILQPPHPALRAKTRRITPADAQTLTVLIPQMFATNDSEDFAESFMLYCVKDPDLSHRSFKYFHDLENRLRHDAASGYSTDADDE